MMTAGTFVGTGSDQDKNELGLPYDHALTLLGTKTITSQQGAETKLVKIRNPWAVETYHGPWSDQS